MSKINKTRGGAPPKNKNPNIIFKKVTALIVTMCMVFAMVPAGLAFADSVTATFDRNSGTLTVNGSGTLTQEIVCNAVGTTSTELNSLKSVVFSAGSKITSIYNNTFNNCDKLESITLPDSLETIGSHAFYGCDALVNIHIPSAVDSVSTYAFSECDNLTTVTFGDDSQLAVLSDHVFQGCAKLCTIVIPRSVSKIGSRAFSGCLKLSRITIPANVTQIDSCAFYNCDELTSVTFEKGSKLAKINADPDSSFGSCEQLEAVNDFPKTITPAAGKDLKETYFPNSPNVKFYYSPEIQDATFPVAEFGKEYNGPPLETKNSYPENVTWSSSDLPAGLNINEKSGIISGTPSVSGTITFNVTASNGKLESSREFSITINQKPSITTDGNLGETNYGESYSVELEASKGYPIDAELKWTLKDGSLLPNGLTIDKSTGVISGTPTDGKGQTVMGTLGFTITATNGADLTDEKAFSLTVNRAPEIITSEVYVSKDRKTSAQLQANAYPKVTKWETTNNLPDGLDLNESNGLIQFTNANNVETGPYMINVTATNSYGGANHTSEVKEITVHVTTAPQITTDKTEYDTVISTQFIVDDGNGSITNGIHLKATNGYPKTVNWSISKGKLPAGLTLDPETGIISGTAIQSGTFTFTVRADNGQHDYTEKPFTITVDHSWKDLFKERVFQYDLGEDGIMSVVDIHNTFENDRYDPDPDQFVITPVNNDGVNGNLLDNAEFLKVYDYEFADKNGNRIPHMKLSNDVAGFMPIDDELAAGWDESDLAVYYIGDNGEFQKQQTEVVELKGKKYLKFLTNHFSKYALVDTLRDDERNLANNSNNASGSGADSSNTGANSSNHISKSLKTGDISLKLLSLIGLAALSSGALMIINKKKKDLDD